MDYNPIHGWLCCVLYLVLQLFGSSTSANGKKSIMFISYSTDKNVNSTPQKYHAKFIGYCVSTDA